jgi:Holliday junction resolvase RusA-like endonuclease
MTRRRGPLTEITIVVHGRPIMRNGSVGNRYAKNKEKQEMHRHVAECLLEQHGPGVTIATPVDVVVQDHCIGPQPRDHMNADQKPVMDGLVKAGLIPDDSPKYVRNYLVPPPIVTRRDELVITLRTVTA